MSGDSLHWPKVMPSWAYRDPAEIAERHDSRHVPREATAQIQTPARDSYYTQARRLHIRNLMRGR